MSVTHIGPKLVDCFYSLVLYARALPGPPCVWEPEWYRQHHPPKRNRIATGTCCLVDFITVVGGVFVFFWLRVCWPMSGPVLGLEAFVVVPTQGRHWNVRWFARA